MAIDRIRKHKIIKVIFDTSILLTPFEFSINIDFELEKLLGSFEILIPTCVIEELKTLSEKTTGKKKRNANAALKLVEKYKTIECKHREPDKALIEIAKKLPKAIVATNDTELIQKLRSRNIPVIYLRGKNRFVLEGELR